MLAHSRTPTFGDVSLVAAALVVLADLNTIATRTALTGSSAWSDVLVLCPGLHRQQCASKLNDGEYPATGAMTTGYVFRIENPATVLFLQKIGITGHLTTIHVKRREEGKLNVMMRIRNATFNVNGDSWISGTAHLLAVSATLLTLTVTVTILQDWWTTVVIAILILARAINVSIIRRRVSTGGWKGAAEPGVRSDLLILMTQDRWIRMSGATDDVKAVTSGNWMRDSSFWEKSGEAIATLLVYLDVALAVNASWEGMVLLTMLLCGSVGLLAVANERTEVLSMFGKVLEVQGEPKAYTRRRVLADELIKETGRDDWAIGLGMVVKKGATVQATM